MATQDKVAELFESIKHDLDAVKKMRTLCDKYILTKEPDENYAYFASKYEQKLNEYKAKTGKSNINPMHVTGYKCVCLEFDNWREDRTDITCYVNDCIHVHVNVYWNDRLRLNESFITISKDHDTDASMNEDISLYIREANTQYFNNLRSEHKWLSEEFSKTGHSFEEFCIVLQALCC